VPAALALSCATHFLVSTVPVAMILSDRGRFLRIEDQGIVARAETAAGGPRLNLQPRGYVLARSHWDESSTLPW